MAKKRRDVPAVHVKVTKEDIIEAFRLGLAGAEMEARAFERALNEELKRRETN